MPTPPPIPVVAATVAPAVDGEIDEVWCSSRAFNAQLKTGDGAPANFAAQGRMLWDERRLYVLLEVVDDVLYQDAFFWYENDHAWLGLDPTPGGPDGAGDQLLFGFTPATRDLQDFESWPIYDRSRILLGKSSSGSTLIFEAAVPWELFPGFAPEAGTELGFELRVEDTSDGKTFTSLSWSSTDEQSYAEPGSWGHLILEPKR